MHFVERLRPDNPLRPFFLTAATLAATGVTLAIGGITPALAVAGSAFVLFSLFAMGSFWRTGNGGFLVQTLYLLFTGLFILTVPPGPLGAPRGVSRFFIVVGAACAIGLIYLFFTRKLKWKGREILELAALSVAAEPGGFTDRPRPAGAAEVTREELLAFAGFMHRNLVAWAHVEPNRVVFVPVRGTNGSHYLYGWKVPDYDETTWVAFDFEGRVTTSVSRSDYLDYREELSVDQLGESLARLFMGFLEDHRKGARSRILERLDALGLSPVS